MFSRPTENCFAFLCLHGYHSVNTVLPGLVRQVNSLFILKSPFQTGHNCVSFPREVWAGSEVFKKCFAFARCQGQPTSCTDKWFGGKRGLWPTFLWFGINKIHHQRKNTSYSTSPLATRTYFKLGHIHSLLYEGRRVNASFGLWSSILVLCYWPLGQPRQSVGLQTGLKERNSDRFSDCSQRDRHLGRLTGLGGTLMGMDQHRPELGSPSSSDHRCSLKDTLLSDTHPEGVAAEQEFH